MTASATMKRIEETTIDRLSIKDRWLVPHNGVNIGTLYVTRPVGNVPEFMPRNDSLSSDVKRSHDYHCAVAAKLGDTDARKFSLKTPKLIASRIKRVIEN